MNRQSTLLSVLAVVLIVALWWFFLYSPGSDELGQIQDEIDAAQSEQASLEQRIASLEMIRSRAPETEAAIASVRSFVPDDPALPGALRQIQASASDAGVDITAISTSRPTPLEAASTAAGLHVASVTLTVEGSYFQLVDFLRRIEDPEITARGIIFNNLTLGTSDYPTLTSSIGGEMYAVLDPVPEPIGGDGAPAPVPSPSPSETATEGADA